MGLENLYQKYPWLNKPSYHLMDKLGVVGEGGWLSEKLPDMWKSYDTQKDFADFGVEMTPEDNPILDAAQRSMNLASDATRKGLNVADEWLDVIELGVESAGDLIYDTTKWGPGGQEPMGIGSLNTDWQDFPYNPLHLFSKVAREEGSGMHKEAEQLIKSFGPTKDVVGYMDPEWDPEKAEEGDFDVKLENWDMYQYWKSGSGRDSADDRRIDRKVESRMDKVDYSTDALWSSFRDLGNQPGYEYLTESDDAMRYYYPQYVEKIKDYDQNKYKQFFEFEETGDDYAAWAAQEYRNELLSKYHKYPVFEDINFMSENLSPFIGEEGEQILSATFNKANEDYINALKEGKSGMTPTEWDYGLFDDDSSVGIDETFSKDLLDYTTPEAKEFMDANQMLALEFIAGGSGIIKTPKILNRLQRHKLLQNTKAGKYAREFAPGLFQWGKRDRFGIPKFEKDEGWRKLINRSTGLVDFARPKGLQFGAAATASELMDRD